VFSVNKLVYICFAFQASSFIGSDFCCNWRWRQQSLCLPASCGMLLTYFCMYCIHLNKKHWNIFVTPLPVGGRGIVFGRFLSLFLCQQHYEKTAGPICMKFSGKMWSDYGTTWFNFGSIQINGSAGQRSICLLSLVIAQWTGVNKSVSFAMWQQGAGFLVPRTTACLKVWFWNSSDMWQTHTMKHRRLLLIVSMSVITVVVGWVSVVWAERADIVISVLADVELWDEG